MKKAYELFLEKTGLTVDEANDFLDMKIKAKYPESKEEIDLIFIENLSNEAKNWKNNKSP